MTVFQNTPCTKYESIIHFLTLKIEKCTATILATENAQNLYISKYPNKAEKQKNSRKTEFPLSYLLQNETKNHIRKLPN